MNSECVATAHPDLKRVRHGCDESESSNPFHMIAAAEERILHAGTARPAYHGYWKLSSRVTGVSYCHKSP